MIVLAALRGTTGALVAVVIHKGNPMQTNKSEQKPTETDQPKQIESTELTDVTGGCAACGNAACCAPTTNPSFWQR